MRQARKAAVERDWHGQVKLLRVAMKASEKIAAAYGVLTRESQQNDAGSAEAIRAAHLLIEITERSRKKEAEKN